MNTQDETILNEGKNSTQKNKETSNSKSPTSAAWQTVTIGGVAGIVLGIAGTRGADAFASTTAAANPDAANDAASRANAETDGQSASVPDVHQATVGQELTFAEAFAAARAEVGPGGVFLWHGQLYGTYYADEWQAMSDAQRDEYAASVQPLLSQQLNHSAHHQSGHHTADHVNGGSEVHVEEASVIAQEPEVHFLGVETREMGGQTVNVGFMTVDDELAALVDLDDDQVFDIHIKDENHNGDFEPDEIRDISEQNLTVDDFELLTYLERQSSGSTAQLDQASHIEEDLAPDMPDYMNDANTDVI